ncbi:L-threonine synthase [Halanaerobium congolense]|jgi:threonine synthase|uniref:Threonine synthase n=2 Tax=Halanaerobium congolense TaxID=54121 RepID=A0A4R7DY83_9FIRM|nr:L-threonine synthase [Halanaerobium congolense]
MKNILKCECGGIVEVVLHNYSEIKIPQNPNSMWDYFELLPLEDKDNIITLSEGMTPLLKTENLSRQLGIKNLFIKDETRNPTGSFKDRPNTMAISKAKELGIKTITIASSGNASASAAAYAAKAQMKCVVFVPENTPEAKLAQAKCYGAEINRIPGNYSNAFNKALEATKKNNWFNVTSTYLNPYSYEGDKTVSYEIDKLIDVPDYIFVPIGAGPLLHGIYKGYKELRKMGYVKKLPKMVGVQSTGCSPIVDAFENGDNIVRPWNKKVSSIASGIDDPLTGYEDDGTLTLKTIYESSGFGIKITDEEVMNGLYQLAESEGVFAEPAGVIGVAAVKKSLKHNLIKKQDKVVIMITGHGLKNIKAVL